MPKLPVVSGAEFAKALLKLRFKVTNRRGDHVVLTLRENDPSTALTVPLHKELKKGTLSSLLKRTEEIAGVSRDELVDLIR